MIMVVGTTRESSLATSLGPRILFATGALLLGLMMAAGAALAAGGPVVSPSVSAPAPLVDSTPPVSPSPASTPPVTDPVPASTPPVTDPVPASTPPVTDPVPASDPLVAGTPAASPPLADPAPPNQEASVVAAGAASGSPSSGVASSLAGSTTTHASKPDQSTVSAAGAGSAPASQSATTVAPQSAASGPSTTAASAAVQSAATDLAATLAPLAPLVQHLVAHVSDPHVVVEDVLSLLAGTGEHIGIAAPKLHKLIDQLMAMQAVRPEIATMLHQLVELTETARALQQSVGQLPGFNAVASVLDKFGLLPSLQNYLAQLVAPGASGPPSVPPVSTPLAITPMPPTGLSPLALPAAPAGAGLAAPVPMTPVLWLHQPLGSTGPSPEVGVAELARSGGHAIAGPVDQSRIVSAPVSTAADALSAARVSDARVAAHASPAKVPRVSVQAPQGPGPASPGAAVAAGGAASAVVMVGAIAALLSAVGLTAPRRVRRLCFPPACRQPVDFVFLLERPG
jgi:hypothetical protein